MAKRFLRNLAPPQPVLLLSNAKMMPGTIALEKAGDSFRAQRVKFLPAAQELMVDDADHVEAIGLNPRIRKMLVHQETIVRR